MEYVLIALVCMASGFASAGISFGYAIINMILLPFIIDIKYAVPVTILTSVFLFSSIVYENLKVRNVKLNPSLVLIPAVTAVVSRYIGISVFTVLTSVQLITILSVFMIALNVYFIALSDRISIKPGLSSALFLGTLSGFFGGLYGIAGPPIVVYYHSVEKDPIIYTTYVQMIFLIGVFTSIFFHITKGNIDLQVLKYSAAGTIGVVVGALSGYKLYRKINREWLTKIIRGAILIMSVVMVFKSIIQILNS